jgi:hypothetical protein
MLPNQSRRQCMWSIRAARLFKNAVNNMDDKTARHLSLMDTDPSALPQWLRDFYTSHPREWFEAHDAANKRIVPRPTKATYMVQEWKAPDRWIACGIYAPDESYIWAQHYRSHLNSYIEGVYAGQIQISGYFTLIRPYPDAVDNLISAMSKPKLLSAA